MKAGASTRSEMLVADTEEGWAAARRALLPDAWGGRVEGALVTLRLNADGR